MVQGQDQIVLALRIRLQVVTCSLLNHRHIVDYFLENTFLHTFQTQPFPMDQMKGNIASICFRMDTFTFKTHFCIHCKLDHTNGVCEEKQVTPLCFRMDTFTFCAATWKLCTQAARPQRSFTERMNPGSHVGMFFLSSDLLEADRKVTRPSSSE